MFSEYSNVMLGMAMAKYLSVEQWSYMSGCLSFKIDLDIRDVVWQAWIVPKKNRCEIFGWKNEGNKGNNGS